MIPPRAARYGACAFGLVLVGLSLVSWSLAERYQRTFVVKRMAAPLKYGSGTIRLLQHGRTIAVLLAGAGLVAVGAGAAGGITRSEPPTQGRRAASRGSSRSRDRFRPEDSGGAP